MQAHDNQCRPTKPTKANTGLAASAQANVHRYFFFLYTKVVTYVIIKFLGFNGVVNIVVVVYVYSEFLTSMYYDPSTPGHPLQKTHGLTGSGSHGFGCGSPKTDPWVTRAIPYLSWNENGSMWAAQALTRGPLGAKEKLVKGQQKLRLTTSALVSNSHSDS